MIAINSRAVGFATPDGWKYFNNHIDKDQNGRCTTAPRIGLRCRPVYRADQPRVPIAVRVVLGIEQHWTHSHRLAGGDSLTGLHFDNHFDKFAEHAGGEFGDVDPSEGALPRGGLTRCRLW